MLPWPCQEVMPGSKMCQRSRWSSLCPPGSGGEGWDLFSFVSEKWLCPSCAGAGARVAAKVLPAGTAGGSAAHTGWTHTHAPLRGAAEGFVSAFPFLKVTSFIKKSSFVLPLRFVLLLHPWQSWTSKQRNSTDENMKHELLSMSSAPPPSLTLREDK